MHAGFIRTPQRVGMLLPLLLLVCLPPETRATMLRKVADDADFVARETNPAFVLAEYFGYLRRNPNDSPDSDFSGFNFWLGKLNSFGGDFRRAEMVKAFLTSTEYRKRFGRPVRDARQVSAAALILHMDEGRRFSI